MPKMDRKDQKVFAGGVAPTNVVAQFGSLADGNPNYSNDLDVIQALSAFDNGWSSAVINNSAPALQDRNALDYVFAYQLAYMMESGVPEYSATQIYFTYGIAKDPATGDLYRSLTDDNVGNALDDTVNWEPVAAPASATGKGLVSKDEVVEKFGNYVSNANFYYAQRGTSQSTNGYGSIDRWKMSFIGSGQTMEQQPFVFGQEDVPGYPDFYMRNIVSSVVGVANRALVVQPIEKVETLAGKEVTISFWAKADAAKDMSINFDQFFGSGGGGSSTVSFGTQKFTLSTTWQKFSYTTNVPSILGKSLGVTGNDFLSINIWYDAGSDYNAVTDNLGQQSGIFDIANVKLEEGNEATKFQLRNIYADKELEYCERFFEKSYNLLTLPGTITTSGYSSGTAIGTNTLAGNVVFKVRKRAIPVVVHYSNATGTAFRLRNATSLTDVSLGPSTAISEVGTQPIASGNQFSAGSKWTAHWTADAEL